MRSAERLAELLAGQHLDQPSLHVDRDAVLPAVAGLNFSGHLRELGDEFLVGGIAVADPGVDGRRR
jgi:hypothetical protein